jgi:uncharacterized protein YndB with AHSA1/START domain
MSEEHMKTTNQMLFSKDIAGKTIHISRQLSAPPGQVWDAWTKSFLLDQWWAPNPWKASTTVMDFREGGRWLYCMTGPNGERHWARFDYLEISPQHDFTADEYFCDENGKKNFRLPSMLWRNTFEYSGTGTKLMVRITFQEEAALKTILEMGFEEGFRAALCNLEELFAK